MKKQRFKLFACNVIVKGAVNSAIFDLQRQKFYDIPAVMYDILQKHQGRTIAEIFPLYPHLTQKKIISFFEFLREHELGHFLNEPAENFPDIDLDFEIPQRIHNAIIDVDQNSKHDYKEILSQLDYLGCLHLELRFYCSPSYKQLQKILDFTKQGRLRSMAIYFKFNSRLNVRQLHRLCQDHKRITSLLIHSSPHDRAINLPEYNILYFKQAIDSANACGQVQPVYFSISLETFAESQKHNSCLNKKIGIDVHGNIKNCPSSTVSFGKIADSKNMLKKVVDKRNFKKLWHISKDQVEICRDCQYRYVCQDCRIFISDPKNIRSKPAKCTFDPYSGLWSPQN